MRTAQLVFALSFLLPISAHIALWDPAMYGWDPTNVNQQLPVYPLSNLPFDQWWFHGYIDQPPEDGVFMDLPSGGTYNGQVACNRAYTTWGPTDGSLESIKYACDTIGPLHTADSYASSDPTDVKGCGIAIAYESDVTKIQPEDFAVISVNYTCPWYKDVDFQIPSDLPPCPEGGCHCMWGWIHSADSGSEQNYFLGYRCNITGATGTQAIPAPKTANKCDYPSDTSNCTVGAKQPHYWYQSEQNNNFQGTYDPPFYNGAYGFMNGAQTDLFAGNGTTTPTASSAASSAAVTSSSSSTSSTSRATSTSLSTSVEAATSTSSSSLVTTASSISATSTTQTTIYVTTTVHSSSTEAANLAAIATGAVSSSSMSTTSTSASNSTSTSAGQCKAKRDLSHLLDTPEKVARHLKRKQRRRDRLAQRRIEEGM